jgi:hypothetical protein
MLKGDAAMQRGGSAQCNMAYIFSALLGAVMDLGLSQATVEPQALKPFHRVTARRCPSSDKPPNRNSTKLKIMIAQLGGSGWMGFSSKKKPWRKTYGSTFSPNFLLLASIRV